MAINAEIDARGVATVTVDNQAKLNTLGAALLGEFTDAIAQLAANQALRVVVLRGAGMRAFIGGADINEMARLDAGSARGFISLVHRACDALRRLPVPVIARIQGYALGAGLEIAASCDMRIAADDARFGMPEVRIGIPSVVEAALLPGLIGWGRTRLLLLTGETITAQTAIAWGLVEEVVRADSLDARLEQIVAAILAAGPQAIRLQKSLITDWEKLGVSDAIDQGIDCFMSAWDTDEPRRMMAHMLERMRRRKAGG